MIIEQLYVPGLSGAQGADTLLQQLRRVPGVHRVRVFVTDRSIRVEHDDSVALATLIRVINQAGYAEVSVLA